MQYQLDPQFRELILSKTGFSRRDHDFEVYDLLTVFKSNIFAMAESKDFDRLKSWIGTVNVNLPISATQASIFGMVCGMTPIHKDFTIENTDNLSAAEIH